MELSSDNSPLPPITDIPLRLQVTANALLWGALGLLAAVLRFGRLGASTLSPIEAMEAWRIWLFWSPDGSILLDPYSPAYFSLTGLLTQIIGFSDLSIRLVPAAAGVAAVVLLYRWRPVLGDLGALVAAFWVAVSPILIHQSRLAGGDALALLALVIVGGTLWRIVSDQPNANALAPRSLHLLAGAAAFGLTTAPLFYTGLLTMAAAAVWLDRLNRTDTDGYTGRSALRQRLQAEPRLQRSLGITAAASFLLSSTLLLWHLAGLGETADLAAAWVTAFRTAFSAAGWQNLIQLAGRTELLPLLTALVIAGWAVFAALPIGRALGLWLGLAVLIAGLQNSSTTLLAAAILPAACLFGYAAERLRVTLSAKGAGYWTGAAQAAALLILLVLIVAANLGRYARISFFDPSDVAHLLLAVLCLLIALFLWGLITVWDPPLGLAAGLMTILAAGLIVQWGIAWRVGVSGLTDHRYSGERLAPAVDFDLFIETTRETARELRGAEQAASLFSAIDRPLLRWYLRDFERATFGSVVPVEATYDLIITPGDSEPVFGADYLGTDFGLLVLEPDTPADWLSRLRHFLFTERPQPATEQRAVLWVRSDLLLDAPAAFP